MFSANPIFGVEFSVEERAGSLSSVSVPRETDDVEIVNTGGVQGAHFGVSRREARWCSARAGAGHREAAGCDNRAALEHRVTTGMRSSIVYQQFYQ